MDVDFDGLLLRVAFYFISIRYCLLVLLMIGFTAIQFITDCFILFCFGFMLFILLITINLFCTLLFDALLILLLCRLNLLQFAFVVA